MGNAVRIVASLSVLVLAAACGGSSSADIGPASDGPGGSSAPAGSGGPGGAASNGGTGNSGGPAPGGRDWKAFPAIVDLPAPVTLWAVSDVHGGYDRLTALLLANGILKAAPATPSDAHWAGGAATLVVAGDMIDKGPNGVEVLDFMMALQADAKKNGGLVVVTLGNHEAEFLVDPSNSKANGTDGIDAELSSKSITPAAFASVADPRGAWLRLLPFGARVGG
jgi:hypothetical protein